VTRALDVLEAFSSLIDERIEARARELARPLLCHQRNCEAIAGVPSREFLRLARDGAFPTAKEKRLVVAKTADVLAYFEMRMRAPSQAPAPNASSRSRSVRRIA
jgi:hypothetical protein